jgi:hypothetical protein
LHDEYIAEPDEAENAADFHLQQFAVEGASLGNPIDLVLNVSGIPQDKLNAVERRTRELCQCTRIEHRKAGLFRKASFRAFLLPMAFSRDNMLSCSKALYRLILEHEVTVSLEKA